MSKFSPAPVADEEMLARFIFSPMHIHPKTQKPKPSLFSHAESKGCSLQRETRADAAEITSFALTVMNNPDAVWLGVVTASCSAMRALRLDDGAQQIACVYDTGLDGNPAHAEIGWTAAALADEGDAGELRKLLMDLFDVDHMTSPQNYRDGAIWGGLPRDVQERTIPTGR